jgi:hypothetical protein
MEGGNATDGAGGANETGQEESKRGISPASPANTERSIKERNLPFGLGRGVVGLLTVARPEQQLPSKTTKVARPGLSSAEAIKVARPEMSQDNFDLDTGDSAQASPATVVMSPECQAQVARWKEQSLLPKIVPPGHETPNVKAAMPSVPGETMMLCPQEIAPVRYEAGVGQATTPLTSLGQVASRSYGLHRGSPNRKEDFAETIMGEALGDEGDEFQAMFEDANLAQKQSPPPPRDHYEEPTDYSSEDSNEFAFTSEGTFNDGFFDNREQSQYKAQAHVNEMEKSQTEAQANMDEREKSQDKAKANED